MSRRGIMDVLRRYGSEAYPLRPSALPSLGRCPLFALMDDPRTELADRGVGPAAHTGTAAGRMIQLYHEALGLGEALKGRDLHMRIVQQVEEEREPRGFEMARMDQAEAWFRAYWEDPRNPQDVVLPGSCEAEVRAIIPAHAGDPTGEPIHIIGHPDQVRLRDGRLEVWDVKAGAPEGLEMLYSHAWQLSAYAVACTETLGEPIQPGGIIRLRGYDAVRRGGAAREPGSHQVFIHASWSLDDARRMMGGVAYIVAAIRRGEVQILPGVHCGWCAAGSPQNCGPRLRARAGGA